MIYSLFSGFPHEGLLLDVEVPVVWGIPEIGASGDRNGKLISGFCRALGVHLLHVVPGVVLLVLLLQSKIKPRF
jgi:hypothetical protein